MLPPFSRRALLGTSAGVVAAAATGAAQAAPADEPAALLGATTGTDVTLPRLMAPTEVEGSVENLDPFPRRLGVAVVGLGHLSLLQILPGFGQAQHVKVTALVSGERDKARAVAAQYGVKEANLYDYASFDALKDNPDVDIVYIVLPNAMHAEYTVRAAQAGKHVLCEKPMATSVADAQRMVDACKQAGRKLMIAYRCQYEPHHRALIEAVRSGQHGPVKLIEAVNGQNNADNGQWRHDLAMAGGGSLPDVGLYCLNATRYITGEEPVEVRASLTRPKNDDRFKQVEDVVAFQPALPVRCDGELLDRLLLPREPLAAGADAAGLDRARPGVRLLGHRDADGAHRGQGQCGGPGAVRSPQPVRPGDGPLRGGVARRGGAAHAGRGRAAGPEADRCDLPGGRGRQRGEAAGGGGAGHDAGAGAEAGLTRAGRGGRSAIREDGQG